MVPGSECEGLACDSTLSSLWLHSVSMLRMCRHLTKTAYCCQCWSCVQLQGSVEVRQLEVLDFIVLQQLLTELVKHLAGN